jgi:hypothetical protein
MRVRLECDCPVRQMSDTRSLEEDGCRFSPADRAAGGDS